MVTDTHLYAPGNRKLVGMDLRTQTESGRFFEDSGGLIDSEEALVAEDIDEIGQTFSRDCRQHFFANEVDIRTLAAGIGSSDGVSAEEIGPDNQSGRGFDAADDTEHFQFILRGEAVSALDFEGTGSHGPDFFDSFHGLAVEFVFAGLVKQVGRIQDSTATGCDFFVGETGNLVPEFSVTASGIDQMGVGIAECRQDPALADIGHFAIQASGSRPF